MGNYREHALDGASAVELVVALYDGILRFLNEAAEAVDRGDASRRRIAVKRALDIVIHLQARLRMDVGGRPAQALSDFYAALFAQILNASQSASRPKFQGAIECARNVRDAWRQAAKDPEAYRLPAGATPMAARRTSAAAPDGSAARNWTA